MLSEDKVRQFERDGFVKGSRVITDEQVEELRAELARVIGEFGEDSPGNNTSAAPRPVSLSNLGGNPAAPVWQIVNIYEASPAFRALATSPAIAEEAAQLTQANELRIWHDQIQYKPAGIGGVNMWHQDSPFWPILQPKTAQVTAWVALDDVDAGNGCMSMVPGSHRFGNNWASFLSTLKEFDDMPAEWNGNKLEVRLCPVRKGEVHFHHSLTWHGSHANTSQRPRRAIAIHYMTEATRYAAEGEHLMKQFVPVEDGAPLAGPRFPLVWQRATAWV